MPDLPVPVGLLSSGQLISSAEDMCHYLIAHLNGAATVKRKTCLQWELQNCIARPVEAISAGVPMGHYGMGWYIEEQGSTKVVYHTGMCPDFYTNMAMLAEQKKGVVLLANGNHFLGELTATEVGKGVTALLTSHLRGFLMLFMPDLSWLALISGSFSVVWSFLRTRMIIHTLRQHSSMQEVNSNTKR